MGNVANACTEENTLMWLGLGARKADLETWLSTRVGCLSRDDGTSRLDFSSGRGYRSGISFFKKMYFELPGLW